MRKKLIDKLDWRVYVHNINRKEITTANVFTLSNNFVYYFKKAIKQYDKTKNVEQFVKDVDGVLQYAYWGKCECEVMISGLFNKDDEIKIDIYGQVKLNWTAFVDYMLKTLELKGEKENENKN